MRSFLLFLHLTGVVVWVGGMFFAHFCLRPVAASQLQPPLRLPLLAAVLGRFFRVVAVAVAAILISGFGLISPAGMANAPMHWHLMMGGGLIMSAIYAYITNVPYPALRRAVEANDWPAGGAAMNVIRQWVAVNLALGAAIIALATLGPLLFG